MRPEHRHDFPATCAGDELEAGPAQGPLAEAASHLNQDAGPVTGHAEAADDESSRAAARHASAQEEGSEHGKKEHGSLFASARAFFKRKEADGKH